MLVERLKAQETEAIAASRDDPTALQRYRELQARRLALEALAARPVATS
jgi:DNA primase